MNRNEMHSFNFFLVWAFNAPRDHNSVVNFGLRLFQRSFKSSFTSLECFLHLSMKVELAEIATE
jgi:hypothetical protein